MQLYNMQRNFQHLNSHIVSHTVNYHLSTCIHRQKLSWGSVRLASFRCQSCDVYLTKYHQQPRAKSVSTHNSKIKCHNSESQLHLSMTSFVSIMWTLHISHTCPLIFMIIIMFICLLGSFVWPVISSSLYLTFCFSVLVILLHCLLLAPFCIN